MRQGVLFVCYGNSCRSIMAEALTRHYWGNTVRVASAGIRPLGFITPHTLVVLEELGVSCHDLYSKGFTAINPNDFQLLVNLTDSSLDGRIPAAFAGKAISWYVRDPYGDNLDSFRQTRNAIEWLVTEKLPEWLAMEIPAKRQRL
jgi:arsenate reductase